MPTRTIRSLILTLTVTGCTSDGASKLTVDCPANGVVSISAASDIGASTNKVIVNVRDATNTKEREVTGIISISVMDKPDAPLLSAIVGRPAGWRGKSELDGRLFERQPNQRIQDDVERQTRSGEKSCGSDDLLPD